MNKTSKNCGPSARQQTTTSKIKIKSPGSSYSGIVLSILLATLGIIGTSCKQETRGKDNAFVDKEHTLRTDSLLKKPDSGLLFKRYDPDDPFLRTMMQRDSIENPFFRHNRKLRDPGKRS